MSSTGIAVLRRDSFASLNADEDGGLPLTRPFVFEGEGRLHINADVSGDGYVRAAVVEKTQRKNLRALGMTTASRFQRTQPGRRSGGGSTNRGPGSRTAT